MKVFLFEPQGNLAGQLESSRDLKIVGQANSLRPSYASMPEHELVLVSAAFPAADIYHFLSEHARDAAQIVIVEIEEEPPVILPFLEAGAAGYVRRGVNGDELVRTLFEIRSGKPPLAPPVGDALLDRMHELLALKKQASLQLFPADCAALKSLTLRELQVLSLIRNGASNQEIANKLLIELGTVKNHVHNILKKLHVTRRSQAAQYVDLLEQVG